LPLQIHVGRVKRERVDGPKFRLYGLVWFGLVYLGLCELLDGTKGVDGPLPTLVTHLLELISVEGRLQVGTLPNQTAASSSEGGFSKQRIHREEAVKRSRQGWLCVLCGEEESIGGKHIVADLTLNPEDEERRRSVCSPPGPVTGVFAPSSASVRCRRRRP